jgi:hypothetical protein
MLRPLRYNDRRSVQYIIGIIAFFVIFRISLPSSSHTVRIQHSFPKRSFLQERCNAVKKEFMHAWEGYRDHSTENSHSPFPFLPTCYVCILRSSPSLDGRRSQACLRPRKTPILLLVLGGKQGNSVNWTLSKNITVQDSDVLFLRLSPARVMSRGWKGKTVTKI